MATTMLAQHAVEKRLRPSPGRPISFSVEQYHAIQDAGAISELRRYELLDGQIVEKEVPKPAHVRTTRRLRERLEKLVVGTEYCIRIQDPVTLAGSEPEPDLAVVAAPLDSYDERHPVPAEIAMLIEVSESSLVTDRTTKLSNYAKAGVATYWVVNLIAHTLEVYTQPRKGTYRKRTDYTASDTVPVVLAKKTLGSIPVKEFLP